MGWKNRTTKPPEEDTTHAFQDATDRFPLDRLLRDKGFHIHERYKKKEAIWVRGKEVLTQSDALKLIGYHAVSDAIFAGEMLVDDSLCEGV